jgi:hypothetical protein
MAKDRYIETIFPIQCFGRNSEGEKVFRLPVQVEVKVSQSSGNETDIFVSVNKCQYNTGGHGQRCKASHPEIDKVGEGVLCPYAIDIPYATDIF